MENNLRMPVSVILKFKGKGMDTVPVRYMGDREIILEAMKKAGEPLNAGKVAELTGLDRKAVDKAFAEMKKDGTIVSPVRCKWEPAKK